MKRKLLLIAFLCPLTLSAQQILDIGIFNAPANSDKLEVRIKPTQTVIGGAYTAGVFTVRFPSSYGVTLTAPGSLNNPLFRYALANQGTDGTYNYYSLSFVSPFTVNWTVGVEYPIAVLQINAGCGSGNGTFEIINNAWTIANNGNVYQELNGIEAQNILYQPTATAPLGTGMLDIIPPTITCPADKTVETDLNRCYYTNLGTAWDAIGNDNCPGFVIRYICSGATVDTVFNLNNIVFNKGLTTLQVTVTDGAGLTASCAFTVTVNDLQLPTISAPGDITIAVNTLSCSATGLVLGSALNTDNCPGQQVTNNAPAIFPLGTTTIIWTVTDAAGLTATATQRVTVQSNLMVTALKLSTTQACSANVSNLSFTLSGGVGSYTVVYSVNGILDTVTNYSSNKLIAVSPTLTSIYKIVSVTDSLGCKVSPMLFVDTLNVLPNPTLSNLQATNTQVCAGASGSFTANGLLPNTVTTFNYTIIPGGMFTLTATSSASGAYVFDPAINPPGVYGMSIQSVTVNGCTAQFASGNAASYTVKPLPTISGISASADVVCAGTSVSIIASGLPPNVSATLDYTLNGVPGTETVLTIPFGTAILLAGVYAEGNYTVVITAITVAGCSTSTNLSATFMVDPFQPICGFSVAGTLATETGEGVEEATVTITGSSNSIPFSFSDFTDTLGYYSFNNTIPLASNYSLRPVRTDNPLNGVTTFDLVLISKHILGVTPLGSPYKIIAADANQSNSVTTFDIVELRKLILGIYQKLPNNSSWRFIDKQYVFPDTSNPFVPMFPDTIRGINTQMNALAQDFVALKVGDVNETVVPNFSAINQDRGNGETLWLKVSATDDVHKSGKIQSGEIFRVLFEPDAKVAGYQFTLEFTDLEVLDISGSEGMDADHFGIFQHAITGSFLPSSPQSTGAFYLTFRARSDGDLSQMLAVSNSITRSEAYSLGDEMQEMNLDLRFKEVSLDRTNFELYQSQPNPFSANTLIPFYLPENDEVSIAVFDERGAEIFYQQKYFDAGRNAFPIDGHLISGTGILFYKVKTSKGQAIRKMLKQ